MWLKGGIPDTHLVARAVLQDWNGGKIPFYTKPPSAKTSHITASVVSSWGKELSLDELLNEDSLVLGSLKSSSEFGNGAVVMVRTSNNGIYCRGLWHGTELKILTLQQSNDADADGYTDVMDQDMMEG